MNINKFRFRIASAIVGLGAGLAVLCAGGGAGTASAVSCQAVDGQQFEKVVEKSGCGVKAGKGSRATALESSGRGTAVAIADTGGEATADNRQPGSIALAGASEGGNARSVTIGPNALALAKAAKGEDTLAVGGAGSQAKIGTDGAVCYGTAALAVELNKARGCAKLGPALVVQ